MHNIPPIDPGRSIDWSHTSADYSTWRPDYPAELYHRLYERDIGIAGQQILDLGTGVGFLALSFARQGAIVSGVDIAEGQIAEAKRCAAEEGLSIDFRVATAEASGMPAASFDVISAGQCWLYFDRSRVVPEVRRLLKPNGRLMTCHFSWLPRQDELAKASEEIVLRFNPAWSAANWSGEIPAQPRWSADVMDVADWFYFDVPVPFTREGWRGRMRACRGVGATLAPAEVAQFEAELDAMLVDRFGDQFEVLHRVDAHIFSFVEN